MEPEQFEYRKSVKNLYKGCYFDSLLELKFVLSIEEEYCLLREPVQIWYENKSKMPTNYIREAIKKYTPDFLIRSKQDNKAYLIELKPRAFERYGGIEVLRELAENYIRWRNVDWIFKPVYDDEIILIASQEEKFRVLCGQIREEEWKRKMLKKEKKYRKPWGGCIQPILLKQPENISPHDYIMWVKYGNEVNREKLHLVL